MSYYIGKARKLLSDVRGFYSEINPATLTGATDIIVIQLEDGSYVSSPWHVRFGKMGVLRTKEKGVDIEINCEPVNISMKLDDNGVAYFRNDYRHGNQSLAELATSPMSDLSLDDTNIYGTIPDCGLVEPETPVIEHCGTFVTMQKRNLVVSAIPKLSPEQTTSPFSFDPTLTGDIKMVNGTGVTGDTNMLNDKGDNKVLNEVTDNDKEIKDAMTTTHSSAQRTDVMISKPVETGIVNERHHHSQNANDNMADEEMFQFDISDDEENYKTTKHIGPGADVVDAENKQTDELNRSEQIHFLTTKLQPRFEVAMSLCGGLTKDGGITSEFFEQHRLSYDSFNKNPAVLSDPNLIIRINKQYYNWSVASALIMCQAAYQKDLSSQATETLVRQHMSKKSRRRWYSLWGSTKEEPNIVEAPSTNLYQSSLDVSASAPTSPVGSPPFNDTNSLLRNLDMCGSFDEGMTTTGLIRTNTYAGRDHRDITKEWRCLQLSSQELASLELNQGMNEASFSVTTQYQGTTRCQCFIYLWHWSDKIIISDIDGTITRSDLLGQVLPMIGKDWSQAGIAELYSLIHSNGYKFLYLSARAIGQSRSTRDYLRGIRQGELSLPDGPIALSYFTHHCIPQGGD